MCGAVPGEAPGCDWELTRGGACRKVEFRRGFWAYCDEGWMETGGARVWVDLSGDDGESSSRGRARGDSFHPDSLVWGCSRGKCWLVAVVGAELLLLV